MKIHKSLVPVMLLAILISCGEDDQKSTKKSSNFLEEYLSKTGFVETLRATVDFSGYFEFGLRFKPMADGTITKIQVKLPANQTDLRVTLWDAESGLALQTEMIATVTADVLAIKEITPWELEKDREYFISINANDWYEWSRVDREEITYPIDCGAISVTGFGYHEGLEQIYPTNFELYYYAGDLSFVFVEE